MCCIIQWADNGNNIVYHEYDNRTEANVRFLDLMKRGFKIMLLSKDRTIQMYNSCFEDWVKLYALASRNHAKFNVCDNALDRHMSIELFTMYPCTIETKYITDEADESYYPLEAYHFHTEYGDIDFKDSDFDETLSKIYIEKTKPKLATLEY